MRHTVLAPDRRSALALSHAIQRHGWQARATTRGKYHVVLVHAPSEVLAVACAKVQFVAGERKGYSSNAG